jgi:hypothetical protein
VTTVAATRARRLISAVVPPVGHGANAAVLVTEKARPAADAAHPVSATDLAAGIEFDHRPERSNEIASQSV